MAESKNIAALREKIVIKGDFILQSPLRIGAGESGEQETDIYVLKNRAQKPIIPGSSLAGILRSACRSLKNEEPSFVNILFGGEHLPYTHTKKEIRQSAIDVNDIVLEDFQIVIRDGVAINHKTGTSIDGSKHNYEAVDEGAHGKLELVVTVRKEHEDSRRDIEELSRTIAQMLVQGIRIGSLTTKGFGLGYCPTVTISFYDFINRSAVKAWILKMDHATETISSDNRQFYTPENFVVDAKLAINGSLLIRHAIDEKVGDLPIKAEHLQRRDKNGHVKQYIIPGTSLKGVFRHQAVKILTQLNQDTTYLDELMGSASKKSKSRFIVDETYINPTDGLHEHIQARNAIDRFSGGVMSSKVFAERPLWQDPNEKYPIKIHFEIRPSFHSGKQRPWDLGLILFLIKDLCVGKIVLGGGKSIGRGILKGGNVIIHYDGYTYEIDAQGHIVGENQPKALAQLEKWASCFLNGKVGDEQ